MAYGTVIGRRVATTRSAGSRRCAVISTRSAVCPKPTLSDRAMASHAALKCAVRCSTFVAKQFAMTAKQSTQPSATTQSATPAAKLSPSKGRARHARRRLKQMRHTIPDLPDTVLEHCSLRHLSFAVRKCRGGTQSVLQAVAETRAESTSSQDLLLLSNLEGGASASLFGH